MITLEQIQLLDKKIKDAVDLISSLREEKKALGDKIVLHEESISSLEAQLSSFKDDSDQIELGFNDVLSQLDKVETSNEPGQQDSEEEVTPVVEEEQLIIEDSEEEVEEQVKPEADTSDDLFNTPESAQAMQFEETAKEELVCEEPGIDEGFPLTPDSKDEAEDSQVNHSEQQENEESRSPQDLDIF